MAQFLSLKGLSTIVVGPLGELPRYKSALEPGLMRRIKTALDPQDLMNSGKLL